jgi:hypothetical protein
MQLGAAAEAAVPAACHAFLVVKAAAVAEDPVVVAAKVAEVAAVALAALAFPEARKRSATLCSFR